MTIRILLLDTGKEWGGGTNSMFELLKRIDRTRFNITPLFYANYRKGEGADLRSEFAAIGHELELLPTARQPVCAKLAKELLRGLLRPLPALRRRALHAIERQWRIEPAAKRIAARLKEGGFDLLYMNNQPSSNLEGYLAAEQAGVPVVQHCRIDVALKPEEMAVVNRTVRSVLCVSGGVRASLVAQGVDPSRCHTVFNAIDSNQAVPAPVTLPLASQGSVVIGSVGSLIQRKANDHLLRAAAEAHRQEGTPFSIVIVGEGPEEARLKAMAEGLGIADRVFFAGFQQFPLPWVAAMDIVVLASAKEGLPRVLLEAMLLGKPVIASDVVGSRELVRDGETGFLYPYGDEAALTRALRRLIESADLRQQLGERGRTVVREQYSIDTYVRSVEALLEDAIA